MYSLLKFLQKTYWVNRRDYAQMIFWWAISINGKVVESINTELNLEDHLVIKEDKKILVDTVIKKFPVFQPKIVVLNKPKGYVVSKDGGKDKTIYDLLPASWAKDFYYIGRLDKESHWLLLLTNEPKLVDEFEHPARKLFKIYEVKIDKPLKSKDIIKMKKWLQVSREGEKVLEGDQEITDYELLGFYDIHYIRQNWAHIARILLQEGKYRHIRRLLSAFDYKVQDLKRIKFGKYELGNLKPWDYYIANKILY